MKRLGWVRWVCLVVLCGSVGVVWGAVGDGIAFARQDNIWYIEDGVEIQLTNDATAMDRFPAWSRDGKKIAFVSIGRGATTTPSIWTVEVATGSVTLISDDGGNDDRPTWSPDGTQIAFHATRGGGATRSIWAITLATGALTPLTDDATDDLYPSWSPDGTRISFNANRGAAEAIWTVDVATLALTRVTQDGVSSGGDEPQWSPDGTAMLINMSAHVSAVDASTGVVTALTDGVDEYAGTWSADGTQIAFRVDSGRAAPGIWVKDLSLGLSSGYTQITATDANQPYSSKYPSWRPATPFTPTTVDGITYTRDGSIWYLDNGTPVQLTDATAQDGTPAWSPDRTTIAFHSDSRGTSTTVALWTVDVATGALTQISDDGGADFTPAWSPDGSQIVFASDGRAALKSLWIADLASGSISLATDTPTSDHNDPAWSPDGSAIAFMSSAGREGSTTQCIWTVDVDTGVVDRITDDASHDNTPVWSPDGSVIALNSLAREGEIASIWTKDPTQPFDDAVSYTRITDAAASDYAPSWSADGAQITFQSNQRAPSTSVSIWVKALNGDSITGYSQVTDDLDGDYRPHWTTSASLTLTPTGEATLTLADMQGRAGGTVTIPIAVTDLTAMDVIGMALEVTYDATLLTPTDDGANTTAVTLGDTFTDVSGWQVEQNVPTPGQLNIGMAGSVGNPAAGTGTLAYVTFDIAVGATPGAASPITLTKALFNEGEVTTTVVDGTFSVLTLVYGDVTGNGEATPFDAAWVLEYVVNGTLTPPIVTTFRIQETAPTWAAAPVSEAIAFEVADVDADLAITAMDSSLILQYEVQLITSFPAEGGAPPAPTLAATGYRLSGEASSARPGAQIVVTLDAEELYAGEMLLEFDPRLLRLRGVSLGEDIGASGGARPALVHREREGQVALAFAAGRPLAGSIVTATFETASDIRQEAAGVVRASRVRLNGVPVDTGFEYRYQISPYQFRLMANYPNPFNPETWIPFELAEDSDVTVRVYGMDGGLVRTLELGRLAMGEYRARSSAAYWDGRNDLGEAVASGVYVVELVAGEYRETRRLVVGK